MYENSFSFLQGRVWLWTGDGLGSTLLPPSSSTGWGSCRTQDCSTCTHGWPRSSLDQTTTRRPSTSTSTPTPCSLLWFSPCFICDQSTLVFCFHRCQQWRMFSRTATSSHLWTKFLLIVWPGKCWCPPLDTIDIKHCSQVSAGTESSPLPGSACYLCWRQLSWCCQPCLSLPIHTVLASSCFCCN